VPAPPPDRVVALPRVGGLHHPYAEPHDRRDAFFATTGQLVGETVRYLMIPQQRTTFGEIDGRATKRIVTIAMAFRAAGFRVAVSRDMQAWLKTHAAFVTCVAAAVYAADGDALAVASDERLVRLMVRAVRESFRALRRTGIREVPWNLRLLHEFMPEWFAVRYWRRAFAGPLGQFSFAAHSNAARDEMSSSARMFGGSSKAVAAPGRRRVLWNAYSDRRTSRALRHRARPTHGHVLAAKPDALMSDPRRR
jgi:2-dehydropantoate 2-reductase